MNMPVRGVRAALLAALLLVSAPAPASGGPAPAPIAIECARLAVPSLRQVGELVGQHDAGQVQATRVRLMAKVRRACHRPGVREVLVVSTVPGASARQLAIYRPAK